MKVWVDQGLCSGCGCCERNAPEVFRLGDDEVSHVMENGLPLEGEAGEATAVVPLIHQAAVMKAAEECPGEIIFVEFSDSARI